jgi:hypothetical protein
VKTCIKCKIEKPLTEFYKHKRNKDGLTYICKLCAKQKAKKWRDENKEKKAESDKKWRDENKEKKAESDKKYAEKNKEKICEYKKKHYQSNKEIYLVNVKKHYQDNKEGRLQYAKQYYQDNKKWCIHRSTQYGKYRKQIDPLFKLKCNLHSRTYQAFTRKSWKKEGSTQEMLGANYETVFNHIESRFKKGMSWDNLGEWHIDHIIPLASANTEKEMIDLCHYTNLQPLWAKENISKGNKIIACKLNYKQ